MRHIVVAFTIIDEATVLSVVSVEPGTEKRTLKQCYRKTKREGRGVGEDISGQTELSRIVIDRETGCA